MGPIAQMLLQVGKSAARNMADQRSLPEIRDLRDQPENASVEKQRELAPADRRAFSRYVTKEEGPLGAMAMLLLAPAEQGFKAVATPAMNAMTPPDAPYSRSGFSNPIENIGASYAGVLQGLNDRGMFGR